MTVTGLRTETFTGGFIHSLQFSTLSDNELLKPLNSWAFKGLEKVQIKVTLLCMLGASCIFIQKKTNITTLTFCE